MRILSNTPDMLILEDRPVFWAIVLAIMVLIGLGFFLGGIFGGEILLLIWGAGFGGIALALLWALRRTRVYLDRRNDLVEIRTQGAKRMSSQRFRLGDLHSAEVQTSGGNTFRVALSSPNLRAWYRRVVPTKAALRVRAPPKPSMPGFLPILDSRPSRQYDAPNPEVTTDFRSRISRDRHPSARFRPRVRLAFGGSLPRLGA